MLEAGLRSSKYPFASFSVSLPTRMEAPRFATPCHTKQNNPSTLNLCCVVVPNLWYIYIYICHNLYYSPIRTYRCLPFRVVRWAGAHCLHHKQQCVPCASIQASQLPSWSLGNLLSLSSIWCWNWCEHRPHSSHPELVSDRRKPPLRLSPWPSPKCNGLPIADLQQRCQL